MNETYMKESRRLDAMTEVLAMIAGEFAHNKTLETAVAGHVVAGMIVRQIEALEAALDKAIDDATGCGDV